jgi:hypothetical protein
MHKVNPIARYRSRAFSEYLRSLHPAERQRIEAAEREFVTLSEADTGRRYAVALQFIDDTEVRA